jgi:hypothetical protein
MARMHPALQKLNAHSGITHCMLFDRRWLASLAGEVEAYHGSRTPFWLIFLTAVDPGYRLLSGASEYETYFNYCLLRHPDEVILKQFCWDNATTVGELRPDLYDYVALHWHIRAEPIDADMLHDKLSKLFSMPMP